MKTFTGTVITTETNLNGERFAQEALEDLLKTNLTLLPVTRNFDSTPIGLVNGFYRSSDNSVNVDFSVLDESMVMYLPQPQYIVPMCEVMAEDNEVIDGILVIKKAKFVEFSLTMLPADTHLTPILPKRKNDQDC